MLSYEISGNCGTYTEYISRKNREASQISLSERHTALQRGWYEDFRMCVKCWRDTHCPAREKHPRKPQKAGHHSEVWPVFGGYYRISQKSESIQCQYRRCWDMKITESSSTDVSIRARGSVQSKEELFLSLAGICTYWSISVGSWLVLS